jgi:hypothetical protein
LVHEDFFEGFFVLGFLELLDEGDGAVGGVVDDGFDGCGAVCGGEFLEAG